MALCASARPSGAFLIWFDGISSVFIAYLPPFQHLSELFSLLHFLRWKGKARSRRLKTNSFIRSCRRPHGEQKYKITRKRNKKLSLNWIYGNWREVFKFICSIKISIDVFARRRRWQCIDRAPFLACKQTVMNEWLCSKVLRCWIEINKRAFNSDAKRAKQFVSIVCKDRQSVCAVILARASIFTANEGGASDFSHVRPPIALELWWKHIVKNRTLIQTPFRVFYFLFEGKTFLQFKQLGRKISRLCNG